MIILDASALVKLVIKEAGSAKAVAGVDRAVVSGEVIAAPEIALAEALNAAWKHFSLAKDISRSELDEAAVQLSFVWSKITHLDTRQLASAAIGIAVENRHSVYDTLYLAACKSNNAPLLTFDEKLRSISRKIGALLL